MKKEDFMNRTRANLSNYFTHKRKDLWCGFLLGMSLGRNIDINSSTLYDLSIQAVEGHDKILYDFCEFIAEIAEACEC